MGCQVALVRPAGSQSGKPGHNRKTVVSIHAPGGKPADSSACRVTRNSSLSPWTLMILSKPRNCWQRQAILTGSMGKLYPYGGPILPMGQTIANYWKRVGINLDTIILDSSSWLAHRRGKMKGAIIIDPIQPPTISSRLAYLFGPQGSYGNYPDIQTFWDQYNQSVDPGASRGVVGENPETDSRSDYVYSRITIYCSRCGGSQN